MKLGVFTCKCAAIVGLRKLEPHESSVFNWRNVSILLALGLKTISVSAYILYDANTFQAYAVSSFIWITLVCMFIGFFIMIFKLQRLFDALKLAEELIDIRKF